MHLRSLECWFRVCWFKFYNSTGLKLDLRFNCVIIYIIIYIYFESCYTYTLQTKGLIYNKFYRSPQMILLETGVPVRWLASKSG